MIRAIDSATALRLMLVDPGTVFDEIEPLDEPRWRELTRVLLSNVVLLRAADRCRDLGDRAEPLLKAADAERGRAAAFISTISRVVMAYESAGIGFVLIKAFQHHPDVATDIDVLVNDDGAGRVMTQRLGARERSPSRASAFAGRRTYDIPNCTIPVEIHLGRLGLAGEHRSLALRVMSRHRRIAIAGVDVPVPAPDDELLVQAVQRVLTKRILRASDVLHITRILDSPLDQTALRRAARQLAVHGALDYMIRSASRLASHAKRSAAADWSLPGAGATGYRLPTAHMVAAFAGATVEAARKGDFERAARVSALPLLAAPTLFDRIRRRLAGALPLPRHIGRPS